MIPFYEKFQLFTPEEIVSLLSQTGQFGPAGVTGANRPNPLIRTNRVYWLDPDTELDHKLWNLVIPDRPYLTWYQRPIQIALYAKGEHYDWHHDVIENRTSRRAVTLTTTLKQAEGAGLEVLDQIYDLAPGEAVLFPSGDLHRATAPIQGERIALTVWYMQPNGRLEVDGTGVDI